MITKALASQAVLIRAIQRSTQLKQAKRNAGHGVWSYRVPPPLPSKKTFAIANAFGAFAWWWIFWHIFTEPEHVYGEWPYISPCSWTDEELGIPPLVDGPLKRIKPKCPN